MKLDMVTKTMRMMTQRERKIDDTREEGRLTGEIPFSR